IGLTILLTIVGKIIGPINETITHTSEVTNGNLTVKLQESDSKDEVGRLRTSVSRLTTFLQDIFGSIGHEVSNITAASSELEKSAQAIRTQATYISDSTNDVSAAIEELAASVEQNSQNSISGAQMAESALASVSECNDSAMKTVAAMNEITDRISIINSIAFQTNILALNAAVEAARAGDAGKGFSVVASDIRKLAERSALAAKEINTVSTSASNAAKSAQEVFTKVLPEINKTSELIREISSSSQEQAQSGSKINTAVQDFTQVTRHFTGIADEVAQNSTILFQRSEELSDAISYFKTE
ncbi:MAG: HAMP domain-containing protein, partial [Bacteroidales bacterium]|nr:HAMP domain-containing protein [Bacteroidales bacterium]